MTDDERMAKSERPGPQTCVAATALPQNMLVRASDFGFPSDFDIRHSLFVISLELGTWDLEFLPCCLIPGLVVLLLPFFRACWPNRHGGYNLGPPRVSGVRC